LGDTFPTPWGTQMWIQTKNNGRVRSQGMLHGLQHFGRVEGRAKALGWDYTYDLTTMPIRTQARGYFLIVVGCFYWPFSFFVIFLLFVIFVNYFLLFKVHCLLLFVTFYCWEGWGELFYYKKIDYSWEEGAHWFCFKISFTL